MMAQCPVCGNEYLERQVKYCSTCGWDLTPYPVTFAGQLPDAFVEKEQAKLAWAKQMWARSQSELKKISQFQSESNEINQQLSQRQFQISFFEQEALRKQLELEELEQEKAKVESDLSRSQYQLEESEKKRSDLQSKLEEISQAHSQLKNKIGKILTGLQQLSQKDSSDVFIVLNHLEKQLKKMETQITSANKSLAYLIPHIILYLAEELRHIPDSSWAIAEIDKMLNLPTNKRYKAISYRQLILQTIKLILETSIENVINTTGGYFDKLNDENYIELASAILGVRHELKMKGIIQRDTQGDTLYD